MSDAPWPPPPDLSSRLVLLSGRLDREAVNAAAAQLLALDAMGDAPIALLVNSPGGPVGDGLALLDVLDAVVAPLEVTAVGRAHGTAAVAVAAAPGRRLAGPRASFLLRCEPPDRVAGPAADLDRHADEAASLQQALADRLAARTGRSVEWAASQLESGQPFTASAALEAGLLDGLAARPPG